MDGKLQPIGPISKDLLYMKVADAVYNYIHTNNLCPGAKIPSERSLAQYLNTGRNSVREALRVLENEDVIEVKTGRGVFVKTNTRPGSIYFKLVKINYLELLEVKTVLEQKALEKIVDHVTPEQLSQLETHLGSMEVAAENQIYSAADDVKFHKVLMGISPNKTMTQMINEIRKILDNYAMEFKDTRDVWLSTIPYHRDLLIAVRDGDLEKARLAHHKIYEIDSSLFNKIALGQEDREGK